MTRLISATQASMVAGVVTMAMGDLWPLTSLSILWMPCEDQRSAVRTGSRMIVLAQLKEEKQERQKEGGEQAPEGKLYGKRRRRYV